MELKVVYRILRKISDWTLNGFYDEVHVEGYENVPKEGPIILCVLFCSSCCKSLEYIMQGIDSS
jgi:hypothetical protein